MVLLGDGECDGVRLQNTLQQAGWAYVCRTGRHMTATWQGEPFRLDTLGRWIRPGTLVELPEALFTEDAYGPILLLCCWVKGYKEPRYLVSNLDAAEEACQLYTKRF